MERTALSDSKKGSACAVRVLPLSKRYDVMGISAYVMQHLKRGDLAAGYAWLIVLLVSLACNFPLATQGVDTPMPAAPSPAPGTQTSPTQMPPIYEPRFESAPCQFEIPAGYAPECGFLVVPEDRSKPDSRQVRLHVAIFRSTGPDRQPDPVIHLSGGPGSPSLSLVSYYLGYGMAEVLARRDYVVFDQRGTGTSQPGLYCYETFNITPTLLSSQFSVQEQEALEVQAAAACRQRLESEGVALAAYNSAASAADVNDLRRVLGYQQVNLYGVSYGSRLALTIMRDYPESVRAVILDSPYPPQVDLYTAWPSSADRAFNALFDSCAAAPACNESYPNLRSEFYTLVDRLNASPVNISITDPETGDQRAVLLTGGRFMDVIFVGLYPAAFIPDLPRLIYEVRDGQYYNLLPARLQLYFKRESSHGLRNSVQCSEEVPFSTYNDVLNASSGLTPQVRDYFTGQMSAIYAICDTWGVPALGEQENMPVISSIPTLILTGTLDPITPPEWGLLASETLSNSYVYEFPNAGHWEMRSGSCALGIGLAFIDNPEGEPDASCIVGLGGPRFR